MKTTFKRLTSAFGLLLAASLFTATAVAQCPGGATPVAKLHRQAWEGGSAASLLRLAADSADPIVGMWRVQFTSDGAVIDQALVQWHADGTELMNSSRNPVTGSYCMGVWKNTGSSVYRLNHYGLSWDPTTSTTSPLGLASIRENVTLSSDGDSYTGLFVITQYDESGNVLATIKGKLVASRINVNTDLKVLF